MVESDMENVANEAHAYTPGLKIKQSVTVSKIRRLPIFGEVFVNKGDKVDFQTKIAETKVPGEAFVLNATNKLGVVKEDLGEYLKKKTGDNVNKDEPIAGYNAFFGLMKNWVTSPIDGYIDSISDVSGQIIIREHPVPVTIDSYIRGEVVDVLEKEGAIIETKAALIQGIFGLGGETHGEIKVVIKDPKAPLAKDFITPDCKDKIIVGGLQLTNEALHKALDVGVAGIVTGSISYACLKDLLGEEIGVAITGNEDIGITIMITEGFGEMAMNNNTLDLFKEFDGEKAAMSGATQIRAGVMRPEVIIPHERESPKEEESHLSGGMIPGTPIRIIRQPYFGALGKVTSLPVELQVIETESRVRVVEVELEDGEKVVIPRANVEILEM